MSGRRNEQSHKEAVEEAKGNIEDGGSWHKNALWNIAKKRVLAGRGAMPREEDDLVRQYEATYEESSLSTWPKEDTEGKAEEVEEMRKRTKEEEIKSGRREVEGEMERIAVDRKRACFEPPFMF